MINFLRILFVFFISSPEVEEQDVFSAKIDSLMNEELLEELIVEANMKNIDISIPYVSFTSSGFVKVIQLKVDSNDGFSGSFTADFSKGENLCVEIFRDFNIDSEQPFYIGDCR